MRVRQMISTVSLNAAIISFVLALLFRALAVSHARKNPKVSDKYRYVSKRDIVPFNSPCQLAREVSFFSAISKLPDRLGILSRAFVLLVYITVILMLTFLLASLLDLP